VRERVRDGEPPRLLLQSVVTDSGGRNQGLLEIALFEDVELPIRVVRPDAGIALRLQLQAHLQLILLRLAPGLLLCQLHLGEGPFQVLNVVAYLMRQHIGLREIATRTLLMLEVFKEPEVHIHLPVLRAVERPHAGTRKPAATGGRAAVENKRRDGVTRPRLGKDPGPDGLCIRQHGLDKGGSLAVRLFIDDLASAAIQERQGEKPTKVGQCGDPQNGEADLRTEEGLYDWLEEQDRPDGRQPGPLAAAASPVIDIRALLSVSPSHDRESTLLSVPVPPLPIPSSARP